MVFGTPVSGKGFFDRKGLLTDLKKTVFHAHHALVGPRGCGKSSILKQLAEMEGVDDLVPVYIDVARVVPKTHRNVVKKIGKEALYAAVRKRGLVKSMPALVKSKMANVVDFARDNLKVKILDWITLYFDPDTDLTEFIEQTFSTIESYDTEMLVMLDEISSIVKISGTQPRREDMDFMEALRGYISDARNIRYIFCGSHTGIMDMIIKVKFGRLLVPKEMGGLEEDGAEELVRSKLGRGVSQKFMAELKERTHFWPLYLQAYCVAANIHKIRPEGAAELDDDAFGLLHGHFRYLEGELSELELMTLLAIESKKVSRIAKKIETSYYVAQSALRTLELKGFVRKVSPGTYATLDPMFSEWLKREYEKPEEWR